MTCRSYRESLLDLARGVAMPAAVARDGEAHIAACARCRLELGRQRELSSELQVPADHAAGWTASAELDERLALAFDALHAPVMRAAFRE